MMLYPQPVPLTLDACDAAEFLRRVRVVRTYLPPFRDEQRRWGDPLYEAKPVKLHAPVFQVRNSGEPMEGGRVAAGGIRSRRLGRPPRGVRGSITVWGCTASVAGRKGP